MDTLSPENRQKNMSHIRAKNTKPEKQIPLPFLEPAFDIVFVINVTQENPTLYFQNTMQ